MIVYKDRAFCYRDCNVTECIRNKRNIEWSNELPVSFMRFTDCENYEPYRQREQKDYYEKEK